MNVTDAGGPSSLNPLGLDAVSGLEINETSMEDCNRRLQKSLMSIFQTDSSLNLDQDACKDKTVEDSDEMESDPEMDEDFGLLDEGKEGSVEAHNEVVGPEITVNNFKAPSDWAGGVYGLDEGSEDSGLLNSSQLSFSAGPGRKWKKRARACFIPAGMNVVDLEDTQKRKDGPILLSPGNIKRPKIGDFACMMEGSVEQTRQEP